MPTPAGIASLLAIGGWYYSKRNGDFDPKQIVWAYFVLPSLNKEDGERVHFQPAITRKGARPRVAGDPARANAYFN
jgi:hypothetical protein